MGVRLASIVLMAVLLVGFAAIRPPGSDPPGEPSTPTCTLRIRQAGGAWTSVTPVDRAKDPVAYYDYFSVSAHTEFVEAYVSKAFFYRNTATGKLYVFVHHNIDEGGSPDAIVDFDFAGLPAAVAVVLSDDPGEFRLGRAVEGQWHFFVNTDGGVLGEFPTGSDWTFTVSPTWGGPDPMRAWRFVDGSGIHYDLDMGKPLEAASVCNRPPSAVLGGPYVGPEGSPITFDASASFDPDGDSLEFRWDLNGDGAWDTDWSSDPTARQTWGDDYISTVVVEVRDPAGATTTASASARVTNVDPAVTSIRVEILGGPACEEEEEDDHDDDEDDPDDDPDEEDECEDDDDDEDEEECDDEDNDECEEDDDEEECEVEDDDEEDDSSDDDSDDEEDDDDDEDDDDEEESCGIPVALGATALDPGSDDLTFTWDFGDGTNASRTYFNDGTGPDPFPSPAGTFPVNVTDNVTHAYTTSGNFTVSLTVTDDDGGRVVVTRSVLVCLDDDDEEHGDDEDECGEENDPDDSGDVYGETARAGDDSGEDEPGTGGDEEIEVDDREDSCIVHVNSREARSEPVCGKPIGGRRK